MKVTNWRRIGLRAGIGAALVASLGACGSGDSTPAVEPPVAATPAPPAIPERQVALKGALERPADLTLTALKAKPATTQTVSYTASGTPTTKTYIGTSLWSLIEEAGVQVNTARSNDILNHYVIARGGDAYRAVFSLGEIHPNFGRRASLVAHTEVVAGTEVPLSGDGLVRVTSPGDGRGGRYVSDLVTLDVRHSGSTVAGIGGGPSTSFTVGGSVLATGSWDRARLETLTSTTATVGTSTYRGVGLWSFLNTTVGLSTETGSRNPSLPMFVVATGSDGYKAIVAMAEIDPNFGNQPVMIAWEIDGAPLDTNGFARLVVQNDDRRGRFVSNLVGLEVFIAQ